MQSALSRMLRALLTLGARVVKVRNLLKCLKLVPTYCLGCLLFLILVQYKPAPTTFIFYRTSNEFHFLGRSQTYPPILCTADHSFTAAASYFVSASERIFVNFKANQINFQEMLYQIGIILLPISPI